MLCLPSPVSLQATSSTVPVRLPDSTCPQPAASLLYRSNACANAVPIHAAPCQIDILSAQPTPAQHADLLAHQDIKLRNLSNPLHILCWNTLIISYIIGAHLFLHTIAFIWEHKRFSLWNRWQSGWQMLQGVALHLHVQWHWHQCFLDLFSPKFGLRTDFHSLYVWDSSVYIDVLLLLTWAGCIISPSQAAPSTEDWYMYHPNRLAYDVDIVFLINVNFRVLWPFTSNIHILHCKNHEKLKLCDL